MDHLQRLIVALFLLVACQGPAHAAFPSTAGARCYASSWPAWGYFPASSPLSCAQALVAHGKSAASIHLDQVATCSGSTAPVACGWNWVGSAHGDQIQAAVWSICPANSTLSGSTCTCTAPYVQNAANNGCQMPPDPQEELCNALSGTETYASAPGNIAPGASSCNATGCMTNFANTLIRVKNAQGQYVTEGAATFTGGTCTYSAATGSAEDTCKGGSSGQVNGVTVCVPYDPKQNTIETVGDSESTTTEGADTTSTSTTSTTTCNNGSCSTTTNVTTTVNGGTPTTKATTTTEPQSEFCTKNPKAPQCGDGGSFTGSCTSSFACTGDAVHCATAKAVNDQLCKIKDVFEMDSATLALSTAVMNGTHVDHPKDDPRVEPLGSFDQTNPFNSACPGDVAFSIASVTMAIPLSQFCAQLQMMGNLLVAFTLLSATMFVIRGVS